MKILKQRYQIRWLIHREFYRECWVECLSKMTFFGKVKCSTRKLCKTVHWKSKNPIKTNFSNFIKNMFIPLYRLASYDHNEYRKTGIHWQLLNKDVVAIFSIIKIFKWHTSKKKSRRKLFFAPIQNFFSSKFVFIFFVAFQSYPHDMLIFLPFHMV